MAGPNGDSYEYDVITLPGRDGTVAFKAALNALGTDGWQVVAIDTVHARVVLKRQLT